MYNTTLDYLEFRMSYSINYFLVKDCCHLLHRRSLHLIWFSR